MAENPNTPDLPKDGPGSNPTGPASDGDPLIGLAIMAAVVAIPPLVGYIVGKVNSNKDETGSKIKNASPITSYRAQKSTIPSLILRNASRDISAQDRRGQIGKIIGRDEEIYQLAGYMGGKLPQSLLLVADDGIGKTALVEGLVQSAHLGKYPELKNFVFVEMDPELLVGKDAAALSEAMCQARDGAIVFFNNFQELTQKELNTRHPLDLSAFEKALLNHELRCIIAINNEGYKQLVAAHPGFVKLFIEQRLEKRKSHDQIFGELNHDIIFQILSQQVADYPKKYGLRVKPQALEAVISLSEKYIPHEYLPGKGLNLLDETARRMRPQMDAVPLELIKIDQNLVALESRKQRLGSNHDGSDPDKSKDIQNLQIAILGARSRRNKLEEDWKEVKGQQLGILDVIIENGVLNHAIGASISNHADALTVIFKQQLEKNKEEQLKAEKLLEEMSNKFACLRMDMDGADIAHTLSEKLGIPIQLADEDEREKLLNLEKTLKRRVIGQDYAIQAVANALKINRTGLGLDRQPIGSFIFIGTTGVGKTELAKALAETWFGDERSLIRFDMTEYQEKHTALRLTGAPPSYVGYEEGGQLTQAILENPYSVVLFDEFDKAHPDIYKLFYQMVDDGRLTDGKGQTVDFSHTIIIFTSNFGSDQIRALRNSGAQPENIDQELKKLYTQQYDAPFIGRISDFIIFNGLDQDALLRIIDLEFQRLKSNLSFQGVMVEMSPAAKKYVLEHAQTELAGARGIRNLIKTRMIGSVVDKILNKEIHSGDSIYIDCLSDQFVISKEKK